MKDQIGNLYTEHHQALTTRHSEAMTATGCDTLVIYAGKSHPQFLDDALCPFRANPHFKTWVPLPQLTGSAIVIDQGNKPGLVYLQPRDYWHAPPADPDGFWADRFDVQIARDDDEVAAMLAKAVAGKTAIVGDDTTPPAILALGEHNPDGLLDRLHFDRAIKTGYEVECMRRANRIAVRGHLAAAAAFHAGASEFEIHMAYCSACGQSPDQLPYDNIVALNGNGAVLHYHNYQQQRQAPQAFLIDAGATCNGYAADITRTYSAGEDDFSALIASVDRAQQSLCALARPGLDYVDLHREACTRMAQVLVEHGVLHCTADSAVDQGIMSTFFPHGLGHLIGVQVHDIGGHQASPGGELRSPPAEHPFLRLTRTLEPGLVCTIEPGIYFIDMLLADLRQEPAAADVNWDRVEQLLPFGGVRVEDDICITTSGHENLSRDAFTQAAPD